MSSPSPILETNHENVTLTCAVEAGNPMELEEVVWYLDGQVLKQLPECNGTSGGNSEESSNLCNEVDPSMLLLQDTTKSFHGNYSCQGKNSAGWGPESRKEELVVYYPPGRATLTYSPWRVIKGKPLVLECNVQEKGRPSAINDRFTLVTGLSQNKFNVAEPCCGRPGYRTALGGPDWRQPRFHRKQVKRYRWHRGGRPIADVVSARWTINPAGLDHRANFSCRGFNDGGEGEPAGVRVDVLAPPSFKYAMNQYTGALYKSNNISLSCTVECAPMCSIRWLKDDEEIRPDADPRYSIVDRLIDPQVNKNDFEAIESTLKWNMEAWEGQRLDPARDNAQYKCRSSANDAGNSVESKTSFAVEFEPEDIAVTPAVVTVEENHTPGRVNCSARGFPVPYYSWRREQPSKDSAKQHNRSSLVLSSTSTLQLGAMRRKDSGRYLCEARNKHGAVQTAVYFNVTCERTGISVHVARVRVVKRFM
ncbi:Hemicentin-2 [Eumeta japonica]|uniref:Hemicentin-2 n=1 Tax=Eumeta variegata TaxID=151549 RepID=A0A4C1XII9_EUMVA|nr:Hemicentin-2 [Eumeta japonica]